MTQSHANASQTDKQEFEHHCQRAYQADNKYFILRWHITCFVFTLCPTQETFHLFLCSFPIFTKLSLKTFAETTYNSLSGASGALINTKGMFTHSKQLLIFN